MRASSFETYQELKYYCLACRAENCVDLPQWHWGQVCIICMSNISDTLMCMLPHQEQGWPQQWCLH